MKKRFDISFVIPGLPFNGDTLKTQALGGSETAAIYMAKALAKKGCAVLVFCNTDKAMEDEEGARYLPFHSYGHYVNSTLHDVTIIQRTPEMFSHVPQSKLSVLWCHDLALGRGSNMYRASMWNFNFAFVLSDYMKRQYIETHDLDESSVRVTRNGIDLSLLPQDKARESQRDRFHVVYAARPERGLDNLLSKVMPALIKKDKRFHLTVCGYGNTAERMIPFYEACDRALIALGDNAHNAGTLTKGDLYDLYRSAGAYLYPTPSEEESSFAEVSCISAMEAQACGLPIVTSTRGALPETIKNGAGLLIEGDPWKPEVVEQYVTAVQAIAESDSYFYAARETGLAHAQTLGWDTVADQWLEIFEKEIRANNDDVPRLVRHMWRNSDIVAARQILQDIPTVGQAAELHDLLKPFEFAFGTEADYAEQYAKIAKTHDTRVFEAGQQEPRFHLMLRWLREHKEDIKTAVDYGCGLGSYAGYGSQMSGVKITGLDIDARTIEIAKEKSVEHKLENADFIQVDGHKGLSESLLAKTFDAGILQEVLEHVNKPWEVAQEVEGCVRVGGWIYITVPFGPWEYSSYHTYPHRCHIWHFDMHDLRDMFGDKPEFSVDSYYMGQSPELGTSLGWWIISYKTDHKPIGEIDMERKRWLQAPRQTLSAAMIVGGEKAKESLHWSLRSLQHVVDEIVIADCGMDEEALHIAKQYPVRVVPGKDPKEWGFEEARNLSLDACRMDWVLWIDADERLLNGRNTHKYLRNNFFHGYGVRQHHFSIDAQMQPDMPTRLFRRGPNRAGKVMRFYGALHEHPELELNVGPGTVIVLADLHIAHLGYLTEDIRQQRFQRNYPLLQLDQQRYPERLLQKFFLMRDKVQIARFELSRNGGRLNPSLKALLQEVVDLGRKHFVGKGNYLNADAIEYYSEALRIMGQGFEVAFVMDADKVEVKPNGGASKYRFLNKEDLMAEMSHRINEKVDPLEREFF